MDQIFGAADVSNPFEQNLAKNSANYQQLTPLSFLARTAIAAPNHTAIIHGKARISYADFYKRCRQLASALSMRGIGPGDTISVVLANTPAMLEAHFGVAMTGAVLHTINTRLDAAVVAFQLDHAGTKLLITDREFSATVKAALALAKIQPIVIDYDDPEFPQTGEALSAEDYEAFVSGGDPNFDWRWPEDEWEAISLNYTSGTTGNPKGVVYHHRGAALMCYANTISTGMTRFPVYLWTLPMFHCNGWCFPWSVTLAQGTHVCLRWVRAKAMYDAIVDHKVTHLSGAPIVMATLLNAAPDEKRPISHVVAFNHAAAPPPAAVIAAMTDAGFELTHLYGLTETYGPATINEWDPSWNDLSAPERSAKRIRQGIRYVALEGLTVMDPETMTEVPADGETLGEVMFRGNIVMKGYLKNEKATEEAFAGGWFHSGDLGVLHPDGYIQLKDRSKDIIISGGENISSIEVEEVLYKHPSVAFCAVVAKPDEKWGETPCAFIELRAGASATEAEILEWCRQGLARYKVPRHVVFAEVPKTSTGKIQKFKLREMAKDA
ncbi:AMP-dependent synthetase and ligase [Hyphomicrobium denitrificans 1NES1]|uniref:3-methylmercaptopropionyl-CoA ligase n=1 Tax=Hyphomicrobium denitrificans 1NES1 TaxID=670307 RepID=N0B9W2_9HYPH|nr:AMP-dependent synthetase and ligase [Hyphomicrobium denitrificans 1NES1]